MRTNKGIGTSAVYLVTRWVSGTSLLIGAEAMVKIGVLSGVIYALAGIGAFFSYGVIQNHFFRNYVINENNSESLIFERSLFTVRGLTGFKWLVFIVNSLMLYIRMLVGSILIFSVTGISIPLSFIIYAIGGYLLVTLDQLNWTTRYKIYPVALLQITMILLLVYLFFLDGVQHIFEGIRLYHPYLLYYKNTDNIKFLIACYIVTFARVLFDPLTGNYLFKSKQGKWFTSLLLSGLIWTTLPIAFSTLVLGIIYKGGFKNFNSLLFNLNHMGHGNVLALLFTIFLTVTVIMAFIGEMQGFLHQLRHQLLQINHERTSNKWLIEISIILLFFTIGFLITSVFNPSILSMLYVSSLFLLAVGLPIIFSLIVKAKDNGKILFISVIGTVIGYSMYGYQNYMISVISLLSVSLFFSVTLISKDPQRLRTND